MVEHFDTSSIPDDPAYWDAATARVVNAVRRRRQSTLAWLSGGPAAWVAAAAFTVISVSLALALSGGIARRQRDVAVVSSLMLTPNDRLGRIIADAVVPPMLTELRLDVADSLRNVK